MLMTLDQIRDALQDRMPSKVADATGLHYNTIRDVRDNPQANPSYETVRKLSDYLTGTAIQHDRG